MKLAIGKNHLGGRILYINPDLVKKRRLSHLVQKTPTFDKLGEEDPNWLKPRGVQQRNAAIEHIRHNFGNDKNGFVYFMDDDNTYSIDIFDEIRKIKGTFFSTVRTSVQNLT